MLLAGKTALVTGAGRGIGEAVAMAFAKEGCDVAVTARTKTEVESTAAALRGLGRQTVAITGDLAKPKDIHRIVDTTLDELGSIDILVNNAGYACFKPFMELTLDEWQQTLDVNLTAPFLLTQVVAPSMIERGGGRIINISSVSGLRPIPKQSAYCAAKHGLNGWAKTIAIELKPHRIAVHWICPGGVDTKLSQEAMPERDRSDWMTPEDIAHACLYLASLSPRAQVDEIYIRRFGSVPLGG